MTESSALGSDLDRWILTLADALGVDPTVLDTDLVLDLSRDVAHGVARPAVPLTSFILGFAAASGTRDRAELERVAARAGELARGWPENPARSAGTRTDDVGGAHAADHGPGPE